MIFNFKSLVIIVAVLAILTRFVNLSLVPPHLSNDEISIAYDAYSVLKTLKDEHNQFLPLSFRSHNTYKAPLTAYLTIPAIAIFGNTEFAARLPSAIFGTLTILIIGLLVFELSQNRYLGLLSSFLLSISPMHILTSRMSYEANIALFFLYFGIFLFFLSIRKNSNVTAVLSFISLALSLYGYHTQWVFTPFIIFLLFLVNFKKVIIKRIFYFGILIFFILITPLLFDFLSNLQNSTRASSANILNEPFLVEKLKNPSYLPWQKVSFILQASIEKYSSYFNLSYLFFTGYILLPEGDPFQTGVFLFPFLPFFLFGIYKIKVFFKEKSAFVYALLITSPITASLTTGPQSTSRNLVSLVPISIILSVGVLIFVKSCKRIWIVLFLIVLLISFLYFLAIFYYHFPRDHAEGFQYGYKQIAIFIKPRYHDFKKIIIDPRFGPNNLYSGVPHLYIPYFTALDPSHLQQRKYLQFGSSFDKYEIREINWNESIEKGVLYIVPASNAPKNLLNFKKIHEVILPDSKPAFYLYTLETSLN